MVNLNEREPEIEMERDNKIPMAKHETFLWLSFPLGWSGSSLFTMMNATLSCLMRISNWQRATVKSHSGCRENIISNNKEKQLAAVRQAESCVCLYKVGCVWRTVCIYLPFMFQEFSGERFLFLVTADGQVLLEILALLLQSQSQDFLFVGFFPFVGQLALEPWRQLLQLLLPLFLLIANSQP